MLQLSVTGINWVGQRNNKDCVLACFAMISGQSYEEILDCFPNYDFAKHGLSVFESDRWLWEHGYATKRRFRELSFTKSAFGGGVSILWPPLPFADLHLCHVSVTEDRNTSHMVVMLHNGTILDPLSDKPKSLGDYHDVLNVTGVYRTI